MQMGRKGRNGQHAVAAGCCILGESAKCPAHHLHTALHTDLHTARGGQPHSRRKRKMSFIPPSYHSEAPIRSAKDLIVQMGRKERNGHHAGAAGCRILGEERNILHTTFTPFRGTDQISQGYYGADGTEGKKRSSCHRGGTPHPRRRTEMAFTPPSNNSEAQSDQPGSYGADGLEGKKRSSCRRGGPLHPRRRREMAFTLPSHCVVSSHTRRYDFPHVRRGKQITS